MLSAYMSFTQESTNYSANRSNADHTMQVLVNITNLKLYIFSAHFYSCLKMVKQLRLVLHLPRRFCFFVGLLVCQQITQNFIYELS